MFLFAVDKSIIIPILIAALVFVSLFLLSIIAFAILLFALTTFIIYSKFFVRTNPYKWSREIHGSAKSIRKAIYDEGKEFISKYIDKLEDVKIVSDGFELFGQYLNINSNKTVLVVQEKGNPLTLSYQYAKPYLEERFNVLFVDSRCHGLSDGRYCFVGLKEYKDIQNWVKFLKEKYNIETILVHGISVGAATSIYALNFGEGCQIDGIVSEGLYASFYDMLKNNLIEIRKPAFPFADIVMLLFIIHASIRIKKHGPIDYIDKVKCPMLMLQGNEDVFVDNEVAEELYITCGSKIKDIVYFDDAPHALVRYFNKEKYDLVIKQFLRKNFKK